MFPKILATFVRKIVVKGLYKYPNLVTLGSGGFLEANERIIMQFIQG